MNNHLSVYLTRQQLTGETELKTTHYVQTITTAPDLTKRLAMTTQKRA